MTTTIKWEIDIDGDAVSVNAYPLVEARRLGPARQNRKETTP